MHALLFWAQSAFTQVFNPLLKIDMIYNFISCGLRDLDTRTTFSTSLPYICKSFGEYMIYSHPLFRHYCSLVNKPYQSSIYLQFDDLKLSTRFCTNGDLRSECLFIVHVKTDGRTNFKCYLRTTN